MSTLEEALAAIKAAPKGAKICAFFDYDGTLIDGYSAAAYFYDRVRRREAGWREIAEMVGLLMRKDLSDDEFKAVIAKGVQDWAGKTETEMSELWQRLFKSKVVDWQFPEAWRLVAAHQAAGHTVAIASSATIYQLQSIAAEMGIEHLLCTQPMIRNGKLTGGIVGEPVWGKGKAQAVQKFVRARKINLAQCFGYANGNEDIDFLESIGKPSAVNPKSELAALALQKDWPTLHFQRRNKTPAASVARTVGAYSAMALSFVAGLGYAKATGNDRRAVDLITTQAADWGLAMAGIQVQVQGEQHLWSHRPAVFLLNHQSKLDFFVMMQIVRRGFTGVAKKEAQNTPGFGTFMKMADLAFIDRSDSSKAREAMRPVVEKLKKGLSICVAPEGTRSLSPRLGAFKKGPFHIAMQAGVPLVPVVIRNAGEMMSRNGQSFRPGTVQVAVLPPISVADWKVEKLESHIAEVRQLYVDTLAHWPGETSEVSA